MEAVQDRGIRNGVTGPSENVSDRGYGRSRLWLGISAVGSLVSLCTLGLVFDFPGMVQQQVESGTFGPFGPFVALLLFVAAYAVMHLPFDVLGGYVLPRRFGRTHPSLVSYLIGLTRGVAIHASLLYLVAIAMLLAGRLGGTFGVVAAGMFMTVFLLGGRMKIATLMAPMTLTPRQSTSAASEDRLPIYMATSADEGFTGGFVGMFRPRAHILPEKWKDLLGPEGFEVAHFRRSQAIESGSWLRGRWMALTFTWLGLMFSAWMVSSSGLGTIGGTIAFSLWFSLWSFGGLLFLPTFSRWGVLEVDERARVEGCSAEAIRATASLLDELQDGEPVRPSIVEAVFHPIPSVRNRLDGQRTHVSIGFWDAARSAVFLSVAGLSLLGRAVHCNCGRPSLWVFLPTD